MIRRSRCAALAVVLAILLVIAAVSALAGDYMPTEQATVVYIIDCSCSMDSGWSSFIDENGNQTEGYRMHRAITEISPSIQRLPEGHWFDVVSTDHPGYAFFGELTESTSENTTAAAGFIHTLHGGGEMGLAPAVTWALSENAYEDVFDYFIVTGGVPTCCIEDSSAYWVEVADRIRGANERNARIHVIVIWPDPDDQVLTFATAITCETGGSLVIIE